MEQAEGEVGNGGGQGQRRRRGQEKDGGGTNLDDKDHGGDPLHDADGRTYGTRTTTRGGSAAPCSRTTTVHDRDGRFIKRRRRSTGDHSDSATDDGSAAWTTSGPRERHAEAEHVRATTERRKQHSGRARRTLRHGLIQRPAPT